MADPQHTSSAVIYPHRKRYDGAMEFNDAPTRKDLGANGSAAREGGQLDAERALLRSRFAPQWPGLKFGMRLSSPRAASPARQAGEPLGSDHMAAAISSHAIAMHIEPGDLMSWATSCMARCPDLRARFPWTEDQGRQMPSADWGGRRARGPLNLAEGQALSAAMWLLHPAYEAYDLAKLPGPLGKRREPEHVLQLPWSPASKDDPGSRGYFRCAFAWMGQTRSEGLDEAVSAGLDACAAMRRGLDMAGAIDPRCWLADSSQVEFGEPTWMGPGLHGMGALHAMEALWSRLEIARSADFPCGSTASLRL